MMKQRMWLRGTLSGVAVAMLTAAMLAPVGASAAGNGGGSGHPGQGQGQGKEKQENPGQGKGQGQGKEKQENPGQGQGKEKQENPGQGKEKQKGNVAEIEDGATSAPEDGPTTGTPSTDQDNHAVMQDCKQGGWQELQREDGTRFSNQGRCVSYAVRGGVLSAVVPTVTITSEPGEDGLTCDATAAIVDLSPTAEYLAELLVDGTADPDGVAVTTDALGDALVGLGSFTPGATLQLSVDGVPSEPTVVCPVEIPIVPTVTITSVLTGDGTTCDATADLVGFAPAADLLGDVAVFGEPVGQVVVTTDDQGAASVSLGLFDPGTAVALSVEGVSSTDTTVCPVV